MKNKISSLALTTICAIYPPAHAQQGEWSGALEEVIVTAQKREANLQETPIAVSAFSGEELDRAQIVNALDIQMSVPNMLMSRSNFSSANIAIRGVGTSAIGSSADHPVGILFNGVVINQGRIFETEFYDTERVEVLRGPQGTLYGRNTTGGLVNVIANKPKQELGGHVDLELGNYGTRKLKGALNVPLTDDLWTRFSGFYLKRDGYTDNIFDDEDVDDRDLYSLRFSAAWQATETLDATLTLQHFDEDDSRMRSQRQGCTKDESGVLGCLPTGLSEESLHSGATAPGWVLKVFGAGMFPQDDYANSVNPKDPRKVNMDFRPRYEADESIAALELNWDTSSGTFTSLTGYSESLLNSRGDYDKTVASELWPVEVTMTLGQDGMHTTDRNFGSDLVWNDAEQWSQEFRFASASDGPLNYLLGAFLLQYETEYHYSIHSAGLAWAAQNVFALPQEQEVLDIHVQDYQLDSAALFGELYWDISERWDATVGLRYTREEKEETRRRVFLVFLDDPQAEDGGFETVDNSWEEPTGKINLNYHLDDDTLLYGTLSRSYKSGGFNSIGADHPLADPEQGGDPGLTYYEPEFINALELGLKSRLLDNSLQANLTGFFYDYEDLQVAKILAQSPVNENVQATILGFEGEFIFAPDQHWWMSLKLSWLDTEVEDTTSVDLSDPNQQGTTDGIISLPTGNVLLDCACSGIEVDLDGNQLPMAPEFSVHAELSYSWPLANGLSLTAGTSYYWQDEYYARIYNTRNDLIDSWSNWNASLLLEAPDANWYTELFVKNINDESNVTGQYIEDPAGGLFTNQFILDPRTYGLRAGYRF